MAQQPVQGSTAVPDGGPPSRLHHAKEIAVNELRRFVIYFLYLWVLLGLFTLHEDLVLRERGIRFAPQGFALINALVLAKVMLIAEELKIGHRLRPRPLIVPIVLDSAILAILFIVVHLAEHLIGGLIAGDTLAAAVPSLGTMGFSGLLCVAVILFVALIPFFGFSHISRALGPGRMRRILLGSPEDAAAR